MESSTVLFINTGQVIHAEFGAFVFDGQAQADGTTYVRGNFISKDKMIKSLSKNTAILKFTDRSGLKLQDERISCVNDIMEEDM